MKRLISVALLVLMVSALLLVGCQKSTPAPVTGEASTVSEEQQISSGVDDLSDLESLDQDLSADIQQLDNITLE
ncbi:MAG: hypothetical protein WCV90_02330 [Candidatus Woesearchaeota archaeon]|jgi:uncharacterized protein YcfL